MSICGCENDKEQNAKPKFIVNAFHLSAAVIQPQQG